jgi:hypothetical protein
MTDIKPGTRVRVEGVVRALGVEHLEFAYVQLSDGLSGWVRASSLTVINEESERRERYWEPA